jgi:ABC-2 type transport system permease protein
MLKGLLKLSWIETKVFVREPLGVFGAIAVPVIVYVIFGRTMGGPRDGATVDAAPFNITILAALLIALSAVQSLISIIAIYREGGILKRLRATPLSPVSILGAHVLVKLGFTVVSLALLVLAGRQVFPGAMQVNLVAFGAALLLGTLSILSLGFVLASIVPTARFAQPLGAVILYPMIAISGLFFPVERMAPALRYTAQLLPTTHMVGLLEGVWAGDPYRALLPHVAGLMLIFAVFVAISAKVFRWE